jgi:hypothetical protein
LHRDGKLKGHVEEQQKHSLMYPAQNLRQKMKYTEMTEAAQAISAKSD